MMQLIAQLQRLADQLKQCEPVCNLLSHESGNVRREKDNESSRSVGNQSASDSDANVKMVGKDKEGESSFGAARARRLALHQQASPGLLSFQHNENLVTWNCIQSICMGKVINTNFLQVRRSWHQRRTSQKDCILQMSSCNTDTELYNNDVLCIEC